MNDKDFYIERNILKIGNRLLNQRSDDLKYFDLTPNQSETLLFFERHDGAMIQDLREYLQVTHQAATKIVDRMRDKELLIISISASDARAKEIRLTEKGQGIFQQLKKKGSNVGSNLLRTLNEDEKNQLAVLLEKIIQNL